MSVSSAAVNDFAESGVVAPDETIKVCSDGSICSRGGEIRCFGAMALFDFDAVQ